MPEIKLGSDAYQMERGTLIEFVYIIANQATTVQYLLQTYLRRALPVILKAYHNLSLRSISLDMTERRTKFFLKVF